MDLKKQYISQAITTASNNLRLSTEKIEVVALLKDYLNKSEDLSYDIAEMKKVTQLSKFAIRLGEIYTFISQSKIDFLKISEKFKEHSHYLIRDLSNVLDVVTPAEFQEIINLLIKRKKDLQIEEEKRVEEEKKAEEEEKPVIDLTTRAETEKDGKERFEVEEISNEESDSSEDKEKNKTEVIENEKQNKPDSEIMKEEYLLNELEEEYEISFDTYVEKILEPVKTLDKFLKDISSEEFSQNDIETFIRKMEMNEKKSAKIGFKVLTHMHQIFVAGLKRINSDRENIDESFIESMRACLIVIVAVVRGKDVNITNYLNRAETFGKQIITNKGN